MFNAGHNLALRRAVAPQLVSDEPTRCVAQAFQQFAEEPLGGFGIAPALHQDVEHVPILIDRTPEKMQFAADPDEHLIEKPFVAGPRAASLQCIGDSRPKRWPQSRMLS